MTHSQKKEIDNELHKLSREMGEAGYVSDMDRVFEDAEIRQQLLGHSEKLAVAYGLISTSPGMPLHISKNSHVCLDCHAAIKFISKMACRAIVMRDSNRFRYMKDGVCSCAD